MAFRQRGIRERGLRLVGSPKITRAPSILMFGSPILHWWAGAGIVVDDGQTVSTWSDVLEGLTATETGNPKFREDHDGNAAVEYDADNNEGHDFDPANFPTGDSPVSFAALVWTPDTDDEVLFWGQDNTSEAFRFHFVGDDWNWNLWGAATHAQIPAITGEWVTVGGTYEGGSNGTLTVYQNDASETGDDVTADIQDANHAFAYRKARNDSFWNGYIAEVVFSDVEEPAQAYTDYFNDRLG